MIFLCYRVTPELCRPTSVTRRSDTGALSPMLGASLGMYRVWSVALLGMYERTQVPSRLGPVRPGLPATNCRGAQGRTPGQCERGFS